MILPYAQAIGIGLITGMRSMMGPALVSRQYTRLQPGKLTSSPLAFMDSTRTATLLAFLSGGELIGDKLPRTPNRTDPGPMIGRLAAGALCGATIAQANKKRISLGALAGGLGALAGTYTFYQLRHWLTQEKGSPDILVALAEDALAVTSGILLLKKDRK